MAGSGGSQRMRALTGIRTVAAVAVCLTHAAFWTGNYTDDLPGRFFARFEIGVALFFVLSGYLLFRPWASAARERTDLPSGTRYFWHRARRILPAYWITVTIVYLISAAAPGVVESATGTGWGGYLRTMTLTQVYGFGHLHGGLTQMWSLAAEVVFYLVLPLIGVVLIGVSRGRWRPDLLIIGLLAVLAISPAWLVAVAGSDSADPTARLWAPAFIGWFAAGMILAVVAPMFRRWSPNWSVPVAMLIFLVSAGELAGEPTIVPTSASAAVVKHLLYLVVAVGLIGPLTVVAARIEAGDDRPNWWSRFCGCGPMVWFGEISYEFFLVHVLVLELVMAVLGYDDFTGSMMVSFLAATAVSVPVAWALHRATAPLWRARTPELVPARG
ncbi:acyltransferase [Gordonia sp. ABSL1-1]|uniref:acyltransferase family protein n=1 Tax=Gordonia sp. ABSL1-1 TaxID=3053923 RepID=UPI002572851A|nr:acyltransferase [Gordonia sp. ABSL1-1]MDL9937714.1 acyltransferase [Gordonia sp. ABSL1-1]